MPVVKAQPCEKAARLESKRQKSEATVQEATKQPHGIMKAQSQQPQDAEGHRYICRRLSDQTQVEIHGLRPPGIGKLHNISTSLYHPFSVHGYKETWTSSEASSEHLYGGRRSHPIGHRLSSRRRLYSVHHLSSTRRLRMTEMLPPCSSHR